MLYLKLKLGKKIYEDETLSISDKVSLLNELSNTSNKIELFDVILECYPKVINENIYGKIAIATIPAIATAGAYRGGRSVVDPCAKICGTFSINSIKRIKCMANCRKKLLDAQIDRIREKDCYSSRNPQKCEAVKQMAIDKIKEKMKKIDEKVS